MSQKIRHDNILGENIRNQRLENKLTQDQVIAQLQLRGINISRSIYSQIETGIYNIKVTELVALKDIFHCTFDDFFINITY